MRTVRAELLVLLGVVVVAAAAYYLHWRSENYEDGTRVYLVRERLHCASDAPDEIRGEKNWPGDCGRCTPDDQSKICALLWEHAASAIACFTVDWRDKMAGEDHSAEVCAADLFTCDEKRKGALWYQPKSVSDCYILRHHREPL